MSDTQTIKDKLDIVDFIQEYVQLKPAGINHKGLCPFHHEKTPSFMVNRDRQSWHCFGCAKGGDIFTFAQDIEGMEFIEALKFLANRAGVHLEQRYHSELNTSQRNRIKEINQAAASFFYNFLTKMDASKIAMHYLEERGLNRSIVDEWQIGFIPDQWDLLTKYLLKKGHSIDDLIASGLTIKREGTESYSGRGYYDRFRGRIMFPIRDVHGAVVGFTGRILVETEHSGGKYVNTPQTIVYDKSRVIFGLEKAKKEVREKDYIILVEGQTDVISSHNAGIRNTVATSGTALTQEQIKLIKRYTNNIKMAFDGDSAGVAAAKRGIDMALEAGMSVKVIQIPEGCGKDPDECVKKDKSAWINAVEHAQEAMKWHFSRVLKESDSFDFRQKQQAADKLLVEIARIPYAVERDHWIKELSGLLDVDTSALRDDLKRASEKNHQAAHKQRVEKEHREHAQEKGRLELLIEELFTLLFRFPSFACEYLPLIPERILSTSSFFPLYQAAINQYNKDNAIHIEDLRSLLYVEKEENIVDILLMKGELDFFDADKASAKDELNSVLSKINEENSKNRRRQIEVEIIKAEKTGDMSEVNSLLEEFNEMS